jgi:hypothetical protein
MRSNHGATEESVRLTSHEKYYRIRVLTTNPVVPGETLHVK